MLTARKEQTGCLRVMHDKAWREGMELVYASRGQQRSNTHWDLSREDCALRSYVERVEAPQALRALWVIPDFLCAFVNSPRALYDMLLFF